MTLRVHHITYATANFAQAVGLLVASARRFGLTPPRVYRPDDAVIGDLARRHPRIMATPRGAGLWMWKPFIIRDALARAADGDVVLYTDVAMTFVADPAPLLDHARDRPIVLFEIGPSHIQRLWTKRDCFVRLDADTPAFWNAPQLAGGFQLYRAGPDARRFVDTFCAAMRVDGVLNDGPNTCGLPDLGGFRGHRHDQAVLTIVAGKSGLPMFPDPSQFGPRTPQPARPPLFGDVQRPPSRYGQIFHLHRLHDCGPLRFWLNRATRVYTGGRYFL